MDMEPKLKMLDLLGAAIRMSWQEREPLALLAAIYALLAVAMVWPVMDLYRLLRFNPQAVLSDPQPSLGEQALALLLAMFASYLLWCAMLGIWARLISMGREQALSGGAPAVMRRTMGVFWRFLEFLGIMMAVVLIGEIAVGLNPISGPIMIGIALAIFMLLAGVFGIAAFETACDRGRWLASVWRDLKGRRGVLALSLILLFLPAMALSTALAPVYEATSGEVEGAVPLAELAYFLFSEWIWGVASCIWITYSGLVVREMSKSAA